MADALPEQKARALIDDRVTFDEYIAAVDSAVDCLEARGFDVQVLAQEIAPLKLVQVELGTEMTEPELIVQTELADTCFRQELDLVEEKFFDGLEK